MSIKNNLFEACKESDFNKIKKLIDTGENIEELNEEGQTPLIFSIVNDYIPSAKFLIENGANIEAKNIFRKEHQKDFFYVVMYACISKDIELVKLLVNKGVKLEYTDQDLSILDMSISWIHDLELIKFLIEKGANINYKDSENFTPLTTAVASGHFDIVKYLLEQGSECDVIDIYGLSLIDHSKEYPEITKLLNYYID